MKYAIIEAEIVEWLKAYEGEKFHALLSDPPYALISIAKRFGPGQAENLEGKDGRYKRLGKGFMGQTWDGFDSLEDYQKWVAEWAKLMIEKILHPGALCLFFGGTRTWHHLAVGLENGGFEIYDSLMWLYGSGFPKAITVSRDANLCLLEGDECRCADNKHNSAYTFPLHNVLDRIYKVATLASEEDAIFSNASDEMDKPLDSQVDYHLSSHSYGGFLRHLSKVGLAFLQPPIYVQEHNRFFALSDDEASESLHSLFPALCNDLPSMQDYLLPSFFERAWQLLQEYKDAQCLEEHLNKTLSTLASGLKLQELMDADISVFRNSHIHNLIFSLPTSILLMLCHKKADTIIPQISLCGKCGKIRNPFKGYSSALKPSWEPIILCRAPRKGQTFASLALEFGSGAINIDDARIGTEDTRAAAYKITSKGLKGGGFGTSAMDYSRVDGLVAGSSSGRWPANLILSHHEDCQLLGDIITPGRVINRWKEGMKPFGDAAGEPFESEQLPPETIERWACVAECPVRQLDDQAGIRSSGSVNVKGKSGKGHQGAVFGVESRPAGTEMPSYGDTGHVSRFFYCGKASRAEKDAGLETFFWKRVDTGYERVTETEWLSLEKKKRAKYNIHPTVKPLSLLQYLSTLILPPKIEDDRRIFVPFSGSGSEIIGSLKAGWDLAIGVEAEAQYNEIAVARIKHNLGMFLVEAMEEHHGEDKAEENNVEIGSEDSPL